ncbi:acyl-CoA dehydrogenase [Streptomyces albospinus]|uniref:Acyl-CoA dehydrogenase n=1 Tax=Streptomyces albospinus TaxID=285515 RepID=A0ABQ2UUY8_9ACTN|nr:acyl-CoA dehydrogenase [Streptomyces albospinus]GGU52341.1 acyl-CoA dehydrogenase [Streptomyces albospinus]
MGIGITQDHRDLAEAARGWAARTVPPDEVRKLLDAAPARPGRPAYWDGLAAQGLLGPHLPEADGGGGGTLLDLAVVLEEFGRAALPGPYLPTVLAAALLHRGGAPRDLVRALATGERVAAVALGAGSLTAAANADGYVLDGTAPPVLAGAGADLLVLAAEGEESSAGQVWLAVDAAPLTVRAQDSADPTRPVAEVRADGVPVPGGRRLAVDGALVRDLAGVLTAAECCGTAAWALHTAAEHAAVREQFGRPIGQFQGVKHLCADMLVRCEQARALVWDAARAADEAPAVRGLVAALATATALDAAVGCAEDCIQILGGIGFTWEHDAHLHLRRAVTARQLLGGGDTHRLRAARHAADGARRALRLELPAAADAFREQARGVIDGVRGLDPAAVRRALAPTGHAAPHLPEPYGLGAGPVQQLAIQQELAAAGVRISDLGIATWVVPSLLAHGTATQQRRYLLPTLRGDLLWCQLFSEPEAGSDLASLRTRATPAEGGGWRINGQKVWTSAAQWADHGILLARTDPDAPKHRGLTFFVVDMKAPGIDVRPLKEITGDALFNEVYFDDVLLPADAVVGGTGNGWRVARTTLDNERVHMADQLTFDTGLESLLDRTAQQDGAVRARIGALAAEAHALGCIGLRTTLQQVSGLEPGPGASIRKLVQTAHQQKVAELALELLGPAGAVREGAGERALHGFLMSRCLTIAGGTTQVQRNVVAERLLGLPRDPEPRPLI